MIDFNKKTAELRAQRVEKCRRAARGDVKGQEIDWQQVNSIISQSEIILCHNATFDRKFLENQAPTSETRQLIKNKVFGCTKNDINWKERGYNNTKLDYLNWSIDYFYDAHRAVTDCWATLNLIVQHERALAELIKNVTTSEFRIDVTGNTYAIKDDLKALGLKWDAQAKCWGAIVKKDELETVKDSLKTKVLARRIKTKEIKPKLKYSTTEKTL